MQHQIFLFLIIIQIANVETPFAQTKEWNLLIDKEVGRHFGYQVYETDSFYYVAGTSIDTFGTPEQGFSVTKIDKIDARVIATHHYEELEIELDFNLCKNGYLVGENIYIAQVSIHEPYFVALYGINIYTLEVDKLLEVPLPDAASSYAFYLRDIHYLDNTFYILTKYYVGEYGTPDFDGIDILIKYDMGTKVSKIITLEGYNPKTAMLKMDHIDDQLIIFGSIMGEYVGTGKMYIMSVDTSGGVNWRYETPAQTPIHDVIDIYPLNDHEVLLVSYYGVYANFWLKVRWVVTRYDLTNKKAVWSTYWNEPSKVSIFGEAKIIPAKNNGEYMLMANDTVLDDTTNYTQGKIIKFTEDGERIWQKTYVYNQDWAIFNDFYDIISISNNCYLVAGYESLHKSPWLVKIDEDGNILPMDTTSTASDPTWHQGLPEISVYPNPASSSIIINQGDITDMTYQLMDMSGSLVKTVSLPQAHHHMLWDISDVSEGTYVLVISQEGLILDKKQQIILR